MTGRNSGYFCGKFVIECQPVAGLNITGHGLCQTVKSIGPHHKMSHSFLMSEP